jgi:hypothetical protein
MASTKSRIDWVPGPAATRALQEAEQLFPRLKRQEVIDKLVISGLSALTYVAWTPPQLSGRNRHRWR